MKQKLSIYLKAAIISTITVTIGGLLVASIILVNNIFNAIDSYNDGMSSSRINSVMSNLEHANGDRLISKESDRSRNDNEYSESYYYGGFDKFEDLRKDLSELSNDCVSSEIAVNVICTFGNIKISLNQKDNTTILKLTELNTSNSAK